MDGCLHLFYINQDAFGEQMHTKLLLCLIVRIQTKNYGEQIQDKSLLCLTARIQMKIHVKQFKNTATFLPRSAGCEVLSSQ